MEKDQNIKTEKNNINQENPENNKLKDNEEIKEEKTLTPEEKITELEDKLTRTFAEMENQRRRYEKEKDEAFEYGGFSFARETLNLTDNLERAKESLKNDESLKNSESLKKALEHLEIIHKDVLSIFKKNNIEPITSINKKLDPNYHQAMMEIEDDEKEPGTIMQEIQKGFTMKDRLLRPALVAVSKKTEKKETKNEKDKKDEENKEKKESK
jgi:molecular chaperone GrpE